MSSHTLAPVPKLSQPNQLASLAQSSAGDKIRLLCRSIAKFYLICLTYMIHLQLSYYYYETIIVNKFCISNKEISNLVTLELKKRHWSIRNCVSFYNAKRKLDPSYTSLPDLNKDFLLRVKNNKFDVMNERIVKLCIFLDIDLEKAPNHYSPLREEFDRVEALLKGQPHLERQLSTMLNSIADLATYARDK
ncbi:hypothetical protein LQR30_22025 [Chromobacterium piscinae]|uniref:hypothetical protein n=1 Tax=Chromobacterium TaxID=535 RepID=UPI001B31F764|nr:MULTISPECIES: hypothetical protein [Chromobacterium]MBP4046273.1 hypothetical protein [Chromobacterium violaceum]MCD4506751.1 hypothetical protein [Chromobacterium piscinae]